MVIGDVIDTVRVSVCVCVRERESYTRTAD